MENNNNTNAKENNTTPTRFNVVVRLRPELGDEKTDLTTDDEMYVCVSKMSDKELKMTKPLNEEVRIFDFDRILGASATQEESYNRVASKIVSDVMSGYNGTIMAYGQTGSGKTFTIFGNNNAMDYNDQLTEDMGIVPRAVKQVFNTIRENSDKVQFQVRVSFMQVYIEQITDLIQDENEDANQNSSFNPNPMILTGGNKRAGIVKDGLQIREDPKSGIFVKGLRQIRVSTEEELLNIIKHGSKFRITSSTNMNKTSSRSHAILQIMVEQKWIESDVSKEDTLAVKKRHYKKGLLTIVDLAGSERISKSGSDGLRLEEAKKINTSVSALSSCISSLANNANLQHVPFRDSKLTRILTECLGGNSKTSICACASPFLMNYDETITTLQFASRAIKIKVNAHINEKIEMKKMKDKLLDFSRIQKMDLILQENKRLEKDANDLKSNFINFKNELKIVKGKQNRSQQDYNEDNSMNDHSIIENKYNSQIQSQGQGQLQEQGQGHSRSRSNSYSQQHVDSYNKDKNQSQFNSNTASEIQDYSSIAKKFHFMILHLQTEMAKATVTINNLLEENKLLKEKVAKYEI